MIRPVCYETDLTAAVVAAGPVCGLTVVIDVGSGDLTLSDPAAPEGASIAATPFFGDDAARLLIVESNADGRILREVEVRDVFAGDLERDAAAWRSAVESFIADR